ncbi:MAG: glycosyltransferase family 2 protein [Pseudomonadota bacterium]|nr:glycosyltransferase family 2 protein [Pseudomonadota bacterium]
MPWLAHLILAIVAVPALISCGYLLLMTLLSACLPSPPRSSRTLRFNVIVPAHNEAAVIANCLASLRRLDWPADQWRLLVVADNCDDGTAEIARAGGAHVLERSDPAHRAKGYALRHAFFFSQTIEWADAAVVIDADTEVSINLLEAFATRIERGADAIQAHYGVLNQTDSWRTGLVSIAHGAFHGVRSRARERLRVSCGLRGNGWCVTMQTLRSVPYRAYSVTEDLEYGIALGLAGYRVEYAGEAAVNAVMESSHVVAGHQRQRWEGGRVRLARLQAGPLLRKAIMQPSRICLDLALDLLVLPLSYISLNVLILIALAAIASIWQLALSSWMWPAAFCAVSLTVYVLRGWQLSGRGVAGLHDLAHVPQFIVWKLRLLLRRADNNTWIPTQRRDR